MERKNRLSGYIPQLNRNYFINDNNLLTEEGIRRLSDNAPLVDGGAIDNELFTKDVRLNTLIRRKQIMGMKRHDLLEYKKQIIERYGL